MKIYYTLTIVAIILVVFTSDVVFSDNCSNIKVPTFMDCQYKCHCKNNSRCDENTGNCDSGCALGWMGPGCQYRNIVGNIIETWQHGWTNISSNYASLAVDGDETTCSETDSDHGSGRQYWYIHFNKSYEVLGIVIKVPPDDIENLEYIRIDTGNKLNASHFPSTCYPHANASDNSTMEIMCKQATEIQQLQIQLDKPDVPLRLCEVEIYGGRHISFNKPSTQISTRSYRGYRWNASSAVDGQIFQRKVMKEQGETCSSTNTALNPWWRVDLKTLYELHEVHFYGRTKSLDQFRGFYLLYGINDTSFTQLYHDATQSNVDSRETYQPMKIPIKPPVIGRYLQVELHATMKLAICEMVAIGDCPRNTCGWNCSLKCFCSTEITGSYKIEGKCPYGCLKGWTGDDDKCDQVCSDLNDGLNCAQDVEMFQENTSSVSAGYFHWTVLAAGGGSLGTVICILTVVIIILVYRQQRFTREQKQCEDNTCVRYSAPIFGERSSHGTEPCKSRVVDRDGRDNERQLWIEIAQ